MSENEARRLLKTRESGITAERWAKAWTQETAGGARAGAAVHTLAGGAVGVYLPGTDICTLLTTPVINAGGKPEVGLCSEHHEHCMPISDRGALSASLGA